MKNHWIAKASRKKDMEEFCRDHPDITGKLTFVWLEDIIIGVKNEFEVLWVRDVITMKNRVLQMTNRGFTNEESLVKE